MNAPFRLFGAELSPYSVKVRSYLRFKGLEFEWLERNNARAEEYGRYAKLPLSPLLVDANETALQDSTLMMETLETKFSEPSIMPADPALAFVAALLEDYADEWLNKAMFHYRWSYPENQESASKRTIELMYEGAAAPDGAEEAVRSRMIGRLHHVGSSTETAPAIEGSFTRLIEILDNHLARRPYLFGGRPSFADFGLAGQLTQLHSDPIPGAMIKAQAPKLVAWLERMKNPKVEGDFDDFGDLREGLAQLLRHELAGAYLIWMSANAQAVADDAPGVSVVIAERDFVQKPQRYAAKAFAELRRKRALADSANLSALLDETGCDAFLEPPTESAHEEPEASDGDEGEGEE